MALGTVGDLHPVGFDLGGLAKGFVGQIAPPEGQRANPCHLRLMRALMGQQRPVVAAIRMEDDQPPVNREASSEPEQAGVNNHDRSVQRTQPG